jgi:hypothetical protein
MLRKFGIVAVLLLIIGFTTAQMWIRQGSQAQEWTVGHAGIGASLTEVKAVPATGGQHHITLILNQSTTSTANQWSIESGTGTNCATGTTAVLPASSVSEKYVGATNAQAVQVIPLWGSPIHVTPGHAICVLGIATQLSRINIVGYTTP